MPASGVLQGCPAGAREQELRDDPAQTRIGGRGRGQQRGQETGVREGMQLGSRVLNKGNDEPSSENAYREKIVINRVISLISTNYAIVAR